MPPPWTRGGIAGHPAEALPEPYGLWAEGDPGKGTTQALGLQGCTWLGKSQPLLVGWELILLLGLSTAGKRQAAEAGRRH